MRKLIATLFLLWLMLPLKAEMPQGDRTLGTATEVAPGFFGPNAFPVPDMLPGRADSVMTIELAADGYLGYMGARTADLFARVRVPLFSKRANLSIWMPVQEWYSDSLGRGHGTGDVYISTDIQLWKARRYGPDVALRVGIKTASGEQYQLKRHFDSPGYWFDLSLGRSFYVRDWEMRVGATAGFLCWQTGVERQNDAVYYGLQALARYKYVEAALTWSGYVGWENAGDRPMTLKARLAGHAEGLSPYVEYGYGIKDFPYHQIRVGLQYNLDIIGRAAARKTDKNK